MSLTSSKVFDYVNPSMRWEIAYQAVPTQLTDVTAQDAHIVGITVYNGAATPITFTVQTKDSTPLPLPLTGTIQPGQGASFAGPPNVLACGGFSVQASAPGLYFSVAWS